MKDFLESLYQIENFGIYLFVFIGVLIVLFLVILFFGKKDAIKNEDKEVKPEESPKQEEVIAPAEEKPLFKEMTEPVVMQTKEIKPEEPLQTVNNVLNEDIGITPIQNIEEPVKEEQDVPKEEKEFDFDALAAAITKELESIEQKENTTESPVLEEQEEAPLHFDEPTPSSVEPKEEIKEEPKVEEKKEEVKPKKVMPTVFSSVYVNRSVEEPKILKEEHKEEVQEEPVLKAKIELPKKIDLPKPKA